MSEVGIREAKISNEVDALLRFYKGRKMISVKDIREFSETYTLATSNGWLRHLRNGVNN